MHIDELTLGAIVKGNNNDTFRVSSSLSENKKIIVELELVEVATSEPTINEI